MSEYELIAGAIERILSAPKITTPKWSTAVMPSVALPPVAFFNEAFIDWGKDAEYIFHPDSMTPDLMTNINIAVMIENEKDGLFVQWLSTASQKQKRRCKRHSKHMVALFTAGFKDGRWYEQNIDIFSYIGGKWVDAVGAVCADGVKNVVWKRENFGQTDAINMLISIAFTARYEYSVIFADDPKNLKARVFAHPDTTRFLLKSRDIGNLTRRRALIHLVKRHAKKRKKTFSVKTHLRGEYRCRWAGLDVTVLPSQFDAERGAGKVTERLHQDGLLRYA